MDKEDLKLEIDKELRIRIRLNYKDEETGKWKSSYKYTGVKLTRKSNWDGKKVKSTDAKYKELNFRLDQFKKEFLAEKNKEVVEVERNENSFIAYFKQFNSMIKNYSTQVKYNSVLKHLENYVKDRGLNDIIYSEVDRRFVEDFRTYLETTPNQYDKISNQKTTDKYLQLTKRVVNSLEEKEIYSFPIDPFKGIKLIQTDGNKKDRLTKEEYNNLLDLHHFKIPNYLEVYGEKEVKRKHIEIITDARDKFVLSIQFGGMRVKDLFTLKWKNFYRKDGDICFNYTMSKTDIVMDVYVIPKSLYYLKDYIIEHYKRVNYFNNTLFKKQCDNLYNEFSLITIQSLLLNLTQREETKNCLIFSTNEEDLELFKDYKSDVSNHDMDKRIHSLTTLFNMNLKKLREFAEIRINLSSHIARHTAAQLLVDSGATAFELMNVIGHGKISTSDKYIKTTNKLGISKGVSDKL